MMTRAHLPVSTRCVVAKGQIPNSLTLVTIVPPNFLKTILLFVNNSILFDTR